MAPRAIRSRVRRAAESDAVEAASGKEERAAQRPEDTSWRGASISGEGEGTGRQAFGSNPPSNMSLLEKREGGGQGRDAVACAW